MHSRRVGTAGSFSILSKWKQHKQIRIAPLTTLNMIEDATPLGAVTNAKTFKAGLRRFDFLVFGG